MKKQVFNPFLPLWEYVPDGEPHVIGDRIYLFGSHDVEGADRYCPTGDYPLWSAPVGDLSDWRYDGIIYRGTDDPDSTPGCSDLYAPDVVQGKDGRFYLYYTLSGPAGKGFASPFSVAVSDKVEGPYHYYGKVCNPDGNLFLQYIDHDAAVLNDEGTFRLYFGYSISGVAAAANSGRGEPDREAKMVPTEYLIPAEKMLFGRSEEELRSLPNDIMGANHVELEDDMLTVRGQVSRIVPGQFQALGTGFEGHAFYEAASCRKIGNTYYFIYSSQESHELCYATSEYPDRGFVYRGILNSNGDVGLKERKPEARLNMTANNHGSLECVNGQWYIFYHRQTHNSTYSRQACAEKVTILPDGSIAQAECTSCGLNGGALIPQGTYPAPIACNLTNGHMPHATNRVVNADIPYITHSGEGKDAERFIANIMDGTMIGFKYFAFTGETKFTVTVRGGGGCFGVYTDNEKQGEISFCANGDWHTESLTFSTKGDKAIYLHFRGVERCELLDIQFA